MSSAYLAPELRTCTANVLAPLGWLNGTFHIPRMQSLVDFLSSGVPILKFVRIRVPQENELVAFVGLRRESVYLIEPTQPDELIETTGFAGRTTQREVGVLIPSGIVRGQLDVLVNVRISDFLRQQQGTAVLRTASLAGYGADSAGPGLRRFHMVVVISRR
jgi:hypothetical protein